MRDDRKEIKNDYFYKGLTAFLVIAASIVFLFILFRIDKVAGLIGEIISILQPVTLGIVIAYLVNPIFNFLMGRLSPFLKKRMRSDRAAVNIANAISVAFSIISFCVILFGFIAIVVPQFAESISEIVKTLPNKLSEWSVSGEKFVKSNFLLETIYNRAIQYGEKWIETDLASFATKLGSLVANGVLDVATFFKNLVIGIIVAVYILFSKRMFANQSKKLAYALFNDKTVNSMLSWLSKTHELFSGFINGKIIDSIIIGIICFVGTALLKIPYAVLISCVIGVTNVIPVFGPWIGGIPSTILVLLVNPVKGLYLGVFIILLQILDGNIIGPKILGSKTGLNNFWVIFAIIFCGGMFGVVGMIIGVPMFALLYHILKAIVNNKLIKKNKSTNSKDYYKSNGDLDLADKNAESISNDGGADRAEIETC